MLKTIIGKPSINPVIFFTGKLSGYVCWVLFVVGIFINIKHTDLGVRMDIIAFALYCLGIIISLISMVNLGESTTLGLPEFETKFKSSGLYKISRNPMYLGFSMMTIGSVIYVFNFVTILLSITSLYTYHLVIMSEERYLISRFGDVYRNYCKDVRRYL